MFALAAIATYTYVKFKNESRYPDIYSENTDGPVFLSFTIVCFSPGFKSGFLLPEKSNARGITPRAPLSGVNMTHLERIILSFCCRFLQ